MDHALKRTRWTAMPPDFGRSHKASAMVTKCIRASAGKTNGGPSGLQFVSALTLDPKATMPRRDLSRCVRRTKRSNARCQLF